MARTYKSPPLSEGCRQLRLSRHTLREIADAIGTTSTGTIGDYLHGRRTPSSEHREALCRGYNIPTDAWDEPPVVDPAPATQEPGTLDEVLTQLRAVKQAQQEPGNSPATRSRLASELRGLLRLRAQLESLAPITEDRIAQSEPWIKLRDKLVAAIKDCPDCAKRVLAALE